MIGPLRKIILGFCTIAAFYFGIEFEQARNRSLCAEAGGQMTGGLCLTSEMLNE